MLTRRNYEKKIRFKQWITWKMSEGGEQPGFNINVQEIKLLCHRSVFRIRIRDPSDPLFFLGSGSGSVKKLRIRIRDPDPDPLYHKKRIRILLIIIVFRSKIAFRQFAL